MIVILKINKKTAENLLDFQQSKYLININNFIYMIIKVIKILFKFPKNEQFTKI